MQLCVKDCAWTIVFLILKRANKSFTADHNTNSFFAAYLIKINNHSLPRQREKKPRVRKKYYNGH